MKLWRILALGLTIGWVMPAGGQTAATPRHTDEAIEASTLAPRYLLKDHHGRDVTPEDFPGRFQLITFGFTSCPDVCPTTLLACKHILDALGDEVERLQPIFISIDPDRDTPSMLREYTTAFHPRILGLTGSPALVQRAAQAFRVRYRKVREPGAAPGVYTMDHSTGMYLLGPDGRFIIKFAITTPAKEVAAQILAMMKADHSRLRLKRPDAGSSR